MQVFIELLVLATGAGLVGFVLSRQFASRLPGLFMPGAGPDTTPFWIDFTPSLGTVVSVAALSVFAAGIAGGVPAFHITGRWRQLGSSGLLNPHKGLRLGKAWTTLLAVQVALALAILPSVAELLWGIFQPSVSGPSFPVQQFVTASLASEGNGERFASLTRELVAQLRAEAGISGVTLSTATLMAEPGASIEVDERPGSNEQVHFNLVDDAFFDVFGARFLAGRRFDAKDYRPGSTAIVVNRSFIVEVLGEGTVLGKRVHYLRTDQTRLPLPPPLSYEVVGVVDDFPGNNDGPMMFHPLPAGVPAVAMTVRSPSGAGLAASRLRSVVSGTDPVLRVGRIESLEDEFWERQSLMQTFGIMLGSVTVIVVLFSVAGTYTLSTFVLAQRWREIGVRAALGAQPRRLVGGIFGRALQPLASGAALGGLMAIGLNGVLPITEAGGRDIPGIVPLSAALIVVVGLLAVAGPARRAIQIDPATVLRV